MIRAAVQSSSLPCLGIDIEAEFSCNDYLLAHGRQAFAKEFLIGERAIHFGSIEEVDATIYSRP